ncbi:MAG: TIGR03808 family TAT-translocated repetitive protein, partial [Mesorhizobium sp.]
VTGSGKNGLALEHVSGRIGRCDVSGAADAGIYSVEAGGLEISGNTVSDCANGGILVHRWQQAEDGTIVSGNRVQRIGARSGGTGQNGNGINAFRAGNVIISANVVSDCAFSAIRANSSSNLQITGNTCSRSGETGIYSEFSFEGAILSNNLVDGAANGISIVNFNEGGRMAVCSNN